MAIDTSGPAFPVFRNHAMWSDTKGGYVDKYLPEGGMSLRDYFAGQALIAITQVDHVDGMGDPERHAARAYEYADALLKAREGK